MLIGQKAIDEDHEKIANLMNEFHEKQDCDNGFIGSILQKLFDYIDSHFHAEERILKLIKYEGLENHTKEHEKIISKVKDYREKCEMGQISKEQVLDLMSSITIRHFLKEDMKFKEALTNRKA
ncbi:MAG: Bacteriohemerythrin [Alphaproteobacteria bacterium ADurb.Bin438]|nr:MAG: Bacteriohemerythrin [Alphaproteobacteria bacterium ADurb.Bin438]